MNFHRMKKLFFINYAAHHLSYLHVRKIHAAKHDTRESLLYISYILEGNLIQEDTIGSLTYRNGAEFIQSMDAFCRVTSAHANGFKRR